MQFFHRGNNFNAELAQAGYDPRIIFDVGAHKGESIESFSRSWPNAKIISFEPVDENIVEIEKKRTQWESQGRYINLQIEAIALSNNIGNNEIVLHGPGAHILRDGERVPEHQKSKIKTSTIDEYARLNNINHIDLLKIDIEGHELSALSGAQEMLSSNYISFIYVEAGMHKNNNHHTHWRDLVNFLYNYDYEIFGFYEQINEFLQKKHYLRRCNIAFINKKVSSI